MESWLLEFRFEKSLLLDTETLGTFVEGLVEDVQEITCAGKVVYRGMEHCEKTGFKVLMQEAEHVNSSALIQGFSLGLLTIDLHVRDNYKEFEEKIKALRKKIFSYDQIVRRKTLEFETLPSITRGDDFSKYEKTTCNLLMEHDFDALVYDQDSPYQNIRIFHSKQYGNCLFLDNDMNLAESDLPYTVAITGDGKVDYRGKTVLILGGGDGGILNYLKDKGPKMITMIDIDEMVIEAAKIHLRGICGDSMDQYEGENYKVIVGDCIEYLKEYISKGQKFDYIINDLTAIPISTEPVGSFWDFLRSILKLSIQVMATGGRYLTQGNSVNMTGALKMYEEQLNKLDAKVSFTKQTVCVPSYHELWVFYTLWKSADSS